MSSEGDAALPTRLIDWITESTNGELIDATRLVGGGSREAWAIRVLVDGVVSQLFLRREAGHGPMHGTSYTLGREGQVYAALRPTRVPVPSVIAIHAEGDAVLYEHLEGDSFFPNAGAARVALAAQFAEILAALHTLDFANLELPPMPVPTTAREHATLELDIWEDLQARQGRPDPLVTFGFQWLRDHVPERVERTVLLQGDTGPGNFMFDGDKIVAVVDWELAHLGDPMEDLAWIVTRSILQPFVPLRPWLERYSQLSGIAIDEERLAFWVVFNVLRCVVGEGVVVASGTTNPERGMVFGFLHLHRRLAMQALARRDGIDVPTAAAKVALVETERSGLYSLVESVISEALLPSVADPMAAHRGRAAARLVRHLDLLDRSGPSLDRAEVASISRLLDREVVGLAEARGLLDDAIAHRSLSVTSLVGYFLAECNRRATVLDPLLGRLASVDLPAWA